MFNTVIQYSMRSFNIQCGHPIFNAVIQCSTVVPGTLFGILKTTLPLHSKTADSQSAPLARFLQVNMSANSDFKELAKWLNQRSSFCSKMLENNAHSSCTPTTGSSTYASMATSSTISMAVQRARSMIMSSSSSGTYKRLNQRERLRAGGKVARLETETKTEESKVFEFVLIVGNDSEGEDEPVLLNEESTLLKGFVQLPTTATEAFIRKEIRNAIQTRYPLVSENDFEFLKASQLQRV